MTLLGGMTLPAAAHAADWYVDAAAGGGGDGSMGSPFASLQDGVDAAMAGDVVHVAPGEYGAISSVRDGSDNGRITVTATEPRTAVILADGTGIELDHTHHTFEGLVVDCGYGSGDCIEGGGSQTEFLGLEVRRSLRDCIDLRNASGVLIDGCDIHHCVAQFDPDNNADAHGITGDSVFDLTVRNTTITRVTGDSIQMSPAREPWGRLVVESSLLLAEALEEDTNGWSAGTVIGENAFDSKVGDGLDGNGQRPTAVFRNITATGWRGPIGNAAAFNVKEEVDFWADGVIVSGSEIAFRLRGPSDVLITNAVVHDVDVGFRMEDDLPAPRVYNVTVGGNVERTFTDAGGEPVDPDLRNLLFLADTVPDLASGDASNLAVDDSVFVDAGGHDYGLLEGSAPTDVGVEIAEVPEDFVGVPRPVGGGYDIGAFEWTDMPPPGDTDGDPTGGSTDGDDSGGSDGGNAGSDSDSDSDTAGGSDGSASDGGGSSTAAGSGTGAGGQNDEGGCSCRASAPGAAEVLAFVVLFGAGLRRRRAV